MISIIGAFGFSDMPTGGQPVKTRELYYALSEKYGKENINAVETYHWKKKLIFMLHSLVVAARNSEILIMLPAQKGVLVFSRILLYFKRKNKKIYYNVIGGWLPEMVAHEPKLKQRLSRFNGIWVETSSMANALVEHGLKNITVVPNFKKLQILSSAEIRKSFTKPYRLCTFSRVMEEKGIEDAVEAVQAVNAKLGETTFILDIYGQIDPGYAERFKKMTVKFPEYIAYKGVVSPSESVQTLKDYFALLFPTKYYSEGIPGTIIDAYAAGVPVITVLWMNCKDIFEEGVTGWGYEFGKTDQLTLLLEYAAEHPEELIKIKPQCLQKSKEYQPEKIMKLIDSLIK